MRNQLPQRNAGTTEKRYAAQAHEALSIAVALTYTNVETSTLHSAVIAADVTPAQQRAQPSSCDTTTTNLQQSARPLRCHIIRLCDIPLFVLTNQVVSACPPPRTAGQSQQLCLV
jgi:hypothetical protein